MIATAVPSQGIPSSASGAMRSAKIAVDTQDGWGSVKWGLGILGVSVQ